MNNSSRKFLAALALVTGIAALATSGLAQTAPATAATPTDDKVLKLEKFEVTGSYLPPAANSVAIPVVSIDAKAIENSGQSSNVLEILRATVPQFTGNGNLGSANANISSGSTGGGSELALRNTSTLVMINGRRVTTSPIGATGGASFVDVNMIPVAAIERIDVLMDGASAIYGTDAVAGVVNIILKTDYQGFEAGLHWGWSTNTGNYTDKSAYLVGGVSNGKTSITITADWDKQTPIWNWQRPYSAVTYGTPTFAGGVNIGSAYYYLSPSITTPTVATGGTAAATLVSNGTYSGPRTSSQQFTLFNLSQYVTQAIGSQRQSFMMAFDHQINDNITAFGDVLYVNTKTFSQINGQPLNTSQAMIDIRGSSAVPAGLYGNPFNASVTGRNRLVNHPRQYYYDTTSIRGVVGFRGKIPNTDWVWETAVDYNRALQLYANPGVINQPHLDAAVKNGDFNFFSRNPISDANLIADQVVGTATGRFESTLKNYDAKVAGKLFDLPGGPVDLALRAELRQEFLSGQADPLSVIDPVTGGLGWSGATTLYPFAHGRNVKSESAEVRIPLAKDIPGAHLLELNGAIRHETYSDTKGPTVPKISLRYLPFNDEFALRASYGKSFIAPALYNLYGPNSIGFTSALTLIQYKTGTPINNFQTNGETGSNPNLKPSNSKNYSVGFVYSPKAVKGLSVSIDYWDIKQTDLVSSIGAGNILQDVELYGAASPYINSVSLNNFNSGVHPTAPGQILLGTPDNIYVTDTLINIASQHLAGADAIIKYGWQSDAAGRFEVATDIGYYQTYQVTFLPGSTPEQDAGHSSLSNGTIPRWISYTSLEWSRGKVDGVIGWRHVPAVSDLQDGTTPGTFDSINLKASYTFGSEMKFLSGAKVAFGINNVFNKFGPKDASIFSDSGVDTSTYGSIGRLIYVDLKYKF